MPSYCYRCPKCGSREEFVFFVKDRKETVPCEECGAACPRDVEAEHGGFRGHPGNWPMESYAVGVHADQVEFMIKESRKRGVPTEFHVRGARVGEPIFRDQKHRKRFCKAFEYKDLHASYGDHGGR